MLGWVYSNVLYPKPVQIVTSASLIYIWNEDGYELHINIILRVIAENKFKEGGILQVAPGQGLLQSKKTITLVYIYITFVIVDPYKHIPINLILIQLLNLQKFD